MGNGPCPSPWRNPQILFVLLVVFLCGSAAGALTMRWGLRTHYVKQQVAWDKGGREATLERFKQQLNLTEAQTKEIEAVLDDFAMYWQTLQAQMDDVRATGKDRITSILTAEQREKFHRMMTELQARQIR